MDTVELIQSLSTIVTLILSLAYTVIRLNIVFSKVVDDAQKHLERVTDKINEFSNKVIDLVKASFNHQ